VLLTFYQHGKLIDLPFLGGGLLEILLQLSSMDYGDFKKKSGEEKRQSM
jgi:hypothetical protein